MNLTYFCPAKVNLFLEVTGKRPNGYHELSTLFAKINWGDTLHMDVTPAPQTAISLRITGPQGKYIPATPKNLVWKAALLFLQHYHLTARVQLTLEKRLPTGAGLGGGSSDAAGVLILLCKAFGKNPLELIEPAATLGADVPLFLYPDTFLKGEGIGEKLTPLPAAGKLPWIVLMYPNTAVSTKEVFARMHVPEEKEILTNLSKLGKLTNVVRNGDPLEMWKPLLFNRLEEYVLPFVPTVGNALASLQRINDGVCRMSGSGSTVFALVGTKNNAQELVAQLQPTKALIYATAFYGGPADADNGDQSSSNP